MGYLSEIVVIGTSWGGLRALKDLIGALPETYGIPLVIVQHRHRDSENILAGLLQECTALSVCEAEDKQPLLPGHVFVAPPDYHLLVERGSLELSTEAPVRYSRPSIDVTFSSASDAYGDRAVGVVLTGANADGSQGCEPEDRNLIDDIMAAHIERPDIMPAQDLILTLTGPYVAGLDTVANTTAAITYTVLKYPEVKRRVLTVALQGEEQLVRAGSAVWPLTDAGAAGDDYFLIYPKVFYHDYSSESLSSWTPSPWCSRGDCFGLRPRNDERQGVLCPQQ